MIDFSPLQQQEITFGQFADRFSQADLQVHTAEMADHILSLIVDCVDADVVFMPEDPGADDPFTENEAERNMPWTLGHVIVHITASAEESAFLAAEMARGVARHGRSRREVPWPTITTIQQCRDRLAESRRMQLATLAVWPDEPYLDVTYEPWPGVGNINAVGRYLLGLRHTVSHLGQIADIVAQAQAAR